MPKILSNAEYEQLLLAHKQEVGHLQKQLWDMEGQYKKALSDWEKEKQALYQQMQAVMTKAKEIEEGSKLSVRRAREDARNARERAKRLSRQLQNRTPEDIKKTGFVSP